MTAAKLSEAELTTIRDRDALMLQGVIDTNVLNGHAAYSDRRKLLGHIDALTADNERLTKELRDAKTAAIEEAAAHDEARKELDAAQQRLAESEAACQHLAAMANAGLALSAIAERRLEDDDEEESRLERELAEARAKLNSLKVDPAKREELGEWCVRLYCEWWNRNSATRIGKQWSLMNRDEKDAANYVAETIFAAGRASAPDAAELDRQLAEANKRFAELTKPTDEEETAKSIRSASGEILGSPESIIGTWDECPERWRREWIALSARVRAPLLQQIAELTKKLEAAEKHTRKVDRISDLVGDAAQLLVDNAESDRDRLAAELAAAKQDLADATAAFNRQRDARRAAEQKLDDKQAEAAEASAAGMREAVEMLDFSQWSDELTETVGDVVGNFCQECGEPKSKGHAPDCKIAKALATDAGARLLAKHRAMESFIGKVRTIDGNSAHESNRFEYVRRALAEYDQALAGQGDDKRPKRTWADAELSKARGEQRQEPTDAE